MMAVMFCLSLSLAVLAFALAREVRLRQAVQTLLRRLLSHWRNYGTKRSTFHDGRDDRPGDAGDDRLRKR